MKVLYCLVLVLFCHQVFSHKHYGYHGKGKLMKTEGEVLRLDVKEVKVTYNSQGIQEEKLMKVDLKIAYKDGRISVNGIPVLPSRVMSFQTQATVVDVTPAKNEINRRSAPVLVRVLVSRQFYRKGWRKSSRLFLEEQIISVDGNKVDQINIKEMVLELGCRGNRNVYFRLNDKKPEESEIHHRNSENDHKYSSSDKDHMYNHHHDNDHESFPEEAVNAFKKLPMPARIAIYSGSGVLGLLILFGLYKLCCRSSTRRSPEQTYVDNVKLVYNPNMESEKPEKIEKKPEVKQAFEEVVVA